MEIVASAQMCATMTHRFVAIGRGGATERALAEKGVPIVCLNLPTAIPNWGVVLALRAMFRKTRPTVVHTHGAEANFHGLVAAWLAGVPARIGEEIGIPDHGLRARMTFKQVYRAAHRVIGISDSVTRWLIDSDEVPARKTVRVYNPVLLPGGKATGSCGTGTFRIGFVGRLEPVKNPIALVKAVKLLIEEGIPAELSIIGEGSQRKTIETYVQMHGLRDRVSLLGFQSRPADELRRCDVYVQPSISEGFGLALVEAMSLGLPVIATAVGGAPEIIEHGRTGWLLPDPSAEAVAAALARVARMGASDRTGVAMAAADAVSGRFEPGAYLREIESLYRDVLDEPEGEIPQ